MSLQDIQNAVSTVVEPFGTTVLTVGGTPTSLGEVLGFVTGAACVYGVARQHLWNWPVGMANNVFFLLLFVAAGLYSDALLQVVFFTLAAYGWWAWLRGGEQRSELRVSRTTTRQWLALLGLGLAGTALTAWLLATYTPSTVPLADGLTTVLSLLATWGQCRKKLESWWLWIAADVVYVPLYVSKDLVLTAILYVGFTALCVLGLRSWRRELQTGREPAAATTSALAPLPAAQV